MLEIVEREKREREGSIYLHFSYNSPEKVFSVDPGVSFGWRWLAWRGVEGGEMGLNNLTFNEFSN